MKLGMSLKKISAASPREGPTLSFFLPGLPGQLFFFLKKKGPAPDLGYHTLKFSPYTYYYHASDCFLDILK